MSIPQRGGGRLALATIRSGHKVVHVYDRQLASELLVPFGGAPPATSEEHMVGHLMRSGMQIVSLVSEETGFPCKGLRDVIFMLRKRAGPPPNALLKELRQLQAACDLERHATEQSLNALVAKVAALFGRKAQTQPAQNPCGPGVEAHDIGSEMGEQAPSNGIATDIDDVYGEEIDTATYNDSGDSDMMDDPCAGTFVCDGTVMAPEHPSPSQGDGCEKGPTTWVSDTRISSTSDHGGEAMGGLSSRVAALEEVVSEQWLRLERLQHRMATQPPTADEYIDMGIGMSGASGGMVGGGVDSAADGEAPSHHCPKQGFGGGEGPKMDRGLNSPHGDDELGCEVAAEVPGHPSPDQGDGCKEGSKLKNTRCGCRRCR